MAAGDGWRDVIREQVRKADVGDDPMTGEWRTYLKHPDTAPYRRTCKHLGRAARAANLRRLPPE
jgi:hypothetical protein